MGKVLPFQKVDSITSEEKPVSVFLNNLKRQAEDNPAGALAIGAAFMAGLGKLISASVNAKNSRSWAKEGARRAAKGMSK